MKIDTRHGRRRMRECVRKQYYATREAAKRGMEELKQAMPHYPEMHAYDCPWCTGWHFGRRKGRKP